MSSQGNGQPANYHVDMSQNTVQFVKTIHLQFAQAGKGKDFLAKLRHIVQKLKTEPVSFGEPLFRLPALKLLVYQAVVAPLVVIYGVHDEEKAVFVQEFKILS